MKHPRGAPRDRKGRYLPGASGNPRGRPIKRKPSNTPEDIRMDFFDVGNSLVTVSEGGRSKKMTISQGINRRLAQKALNGDRGCIVLWKKLEATHVTEELKQQLEMYELILTGEKTIRDFPEGVTDRYIELVRTLKKRLHNDIGD